MKKNKSKIDKFLNILKNAFNKSKVPHSSQSKFKKAINRFSKSLLVFIAILPFAGFFIVLGKMIGPLGLGRIPGVEVAFIHIGNIFEQIGWLVFNNMGLFFAISIAGVFAHNWAGGAFVGALSYMTLLVIGSTFFMQRDDQFLNYILGKWQNSDAYFTNILGFYSLNYGAFGGILTGIASGMLYNKFYSFSKFPKFLNFFNGPRFIPFVIFGFTLVAGVIFTLFWPLFQYVISLIGNFVNDSKIPFLGPFVYGVSERLILPFGLHYMLVFPMNYDIFGGNFDFLNLSSDAYSQIDPQKARQIILFLEWFRDSSPSGVNFDFLNVEGQEKMWYSWFSILQYIQSDWHNFASENPGLVTLNSGQAFDVLFYGLTPARYKVGQMLLSNAGLIMAAIAMIYVLPIEDKKEHRPLYVAGIITCGLMGITEPIEFLFVYTAPLFWIIHVIFSGLAYGVFDFGFPIRIHASGGVDTVVKTFSVLVLNFFAFWKDVVFLLIYSIIFGGLYFVVFYFGMKYFRPHIPGMYPHEDDLVMSSRGPPRPKENNI